MDNARWAQVEELFHHAAKLEDTRRAQFLEHACAGDQELRQELESLLAQKEKSQQFLEVPAVELLGQLIADQTRREDDYRLIGRTISHYRVIERLGGGGMGIVYKAEDTRLHRFVALKFLPKDLAGDPKWLDRFQREAEAASALNHPNICTIYDIGEDDGKAFIAMEFLHGENLRQMISRGSLATDQALSIGVQVADALEAAHRNGIVHRDVKPANIFVVDGGHTKLLDFGVAKLTREGEGASEKPAGLGQQQFSEHLTQTGIAVGTAAYMSPEQIRGEAIDQRTDLFSFGVVLYEIASGVRPFNGSASESVAQAILHEDPPSVATVNPKLSPKVAAIISKALQKKPEERYQHASELSADLRRVTREIEGTQANRKALQALWQRTSAGARIAILVLSVVAAIAAAAIYRLHRAKIALTERDTVVLADFDNRTGDPVFDDALKTALDIALNQSPFLNALSDNNVAATLKFMSRPPDTKLTAGIAREICERAGGRAYIAGSIAGQASQYLLELKAVNCQSGDTVADEKVTAANKQKVLDALSEATSKLRGELGESLATVQKFDVPLAQATTSSLDALKAYSLGEGVFHEKGPTAALPYHQRAIELDPDFATAYNAISGDYSMLGQMARSNEYRLKAFQLREHASEREKFLITGAYYAYVTGELNKAAEILRQMVENYPRDPGPYASLSIAYDEQGEYDRAAETIRRAMPLVRDVVGYYDDFVNDDVALQRFDDAHQVIEQAHERKLDDGVIHSALYALGFLSGDDDAITKEQQWLESHPAFENWAFSLASDTKAYGGHLAAARELTKQAIESAVKADSKEGAAVFQAVSAQREAAFGYKARARNEADRALKLDPASDGVESESALAFAMAGDSQRANAMAGDLAKRFPLNQQMQSIWLAAIRFQSSVNQHNSASVLKTAPPASTLELGQIGFVLNLSCLYPSYFRGQAHLAAGEGVQAAMEFRKILDHDGIVWNCWTGALARLGMARANALQARTSQGADADAARVRALAAYKDFLTLWKDADSDIPILKRAKAEYERMQ